MSTECPVACLGGVMSKEIEGEDTGCGMRSVNIILLNLWGKNRNNNNDNDNNRALSANIDPSIQMKLCP